MEDLQIFNKHQAYLDSLDSEEKVLTAIQFITNNPDCDTRILQVAVELKHAAD